jgi:ADP-ribose pyrophosphatase
MAKQRIKIGQWKTVYKGIFTTIKQAKAIYPDGQTKIWERDFRISTVIVLAFDEKGKFLLTREYRTRSQKYEWRVVAGRIDDSRLTPKQNAQKELREEAGFSAGRLKKIMVWQIDGRNTYVYLATNLKSNPLTNDECEDITVYFLSFSKVYQMCLDNKIKNAHIAMSIILLYQKIKNGEIKI